MTMNGCPEDPRQRAGSAPRARSRAPPRSGRGSPGRSPWDPCRGDALGQAQDQPQVLHVGAHGGGHAGVLDLDRDLAPVGQRGAVDLADRRRRDRLLVELVEDLLQRLAELVLDHLAHLLEGDRGCGVAQRGQLVLELLPVLLGDHADVEERHHLADLHRRALHRPERGDDLLGRFDVTALEGGVAAVLGARDVGRPGARLTDRLSGRKPPDLGGSPHARGGDLVSRHCWGFYAASCSTREPGTMSSDPSGQRIQALCPPS